MTFHSFFLQNFHTQAQKITTIESKEYPEWFHQVTSVLRAKQGSEFYILDNTGGRYLMQIQSIDKKSAVLLCLNQENKKEEARLTLWIPLIKLTKLEIALQMCTQIGVTHFKIFRSDFTDEKIGLLSDNKKERLLRIVTEASEQSERFFVPKIEYITNDLKELHFEELVHVAVEREQFEKSDSLENTAKNVMVGPEGGWSPAEIEFFKKDPRFYPLDLQCSNILRAETAAVVAISRASS